MAPQGSNTDEDTYFIGYLKGGTPVQLGLTLPTTSTLDGQVQLLDAAGNVVTDTAGSATDAAFIGTTPAAGGYYGRRVRQLGGRGGRRLRAGPERVGQRVAGGGRHDAPGAPGRRRTRCCSSST